MPVKVRLDLDKSAADKGLEAFGQKAAGILGDLKESVEEALDLEKLDRGFEGAGKALDLFGKVADRAFGPLAAHIGEALGEAFEFSEAGMKIGAAWGPIGGIIGGLAGLLVDASIKAYEFFTATKKISAQWLELQGSVKTTQERLEELKNSAFDLDTLDLSSALSVLGELQSQISAANAAALAGVAGFDKVAGTLKGQFDTLAQSSLEGLIFKVDTLAYGLDTLGEEKTIPQLKSDLEEAGKAVETAKGRVGDLRKELASTKLISVERLLTLFADYKRATYDAEKATKELAAADKAYTDAATKGAAARKKAREEEKKALADQLKILNDSVIFELNKEAIEARLAREELDRIEEEKEAYEAAVEDQIQASIRWHDQQSEARARARDEEEEYREERRLALEEDFAELTAGYQDALAPLAQFVGAIFGAITKNIEAGNKALAGVGRAARGAVAEILKGFAKQWGAQAIAELAAGFASLALGPIGGVPASQHFAAAGLYGAAAAAAGVGGAALSRGASSPASSPAASAGGSPSLGSGDRAPSQGGTIIVQMSGNMFLEGGERDIARAGRRIAGAVNASRRDRLAA